MWKRTLLLSIISFSSIAKVELPTNKIRSQFVEKKKVEALNLLSDAFHHPSATATQKVHFTRMWNFLKYTGVNFPPVGQDYMEIGDEKEFCRKAVAFADRGKVYICGSFLDKGETNDKLFANVLIHEAAHATGVDRELDEDRECGADLASIQAHRLAGKRSPALDGHYVSSGRCKF